MFFKLNFSNRESMYEYFLKNEIERELEKYE